MTSVLFIGKIGGIFLAAISVFWPLLGFVMLLFVTAANTANLLWMYSNEERWLPIVQVISGITIFMIMILAIPLVIYFSRIGNLSNATVVFDPKFSSVVSKLSDVTQAGDAVATAKVDVALAFGADVVLAAPGSFQVSSTCEFSWFHQSETSDRYGKKKKETDRVDCVVLPRSAVFSIF